MRSSACLSQEIRYMQNMLQRACIQRADTGCKEGILVTGLKQIYIFSYCNIKNKEAIFHDIERSYCRYAYKNT